MVTDGIFRSYKLPGTGETIKLLKREVLEKAIKAAMANSRPVEDKARKDVPDRVSER